MFIMAGISPGTTAKPSILLTDDQLNITAQMAEPGCRVHVLTDSKEIIQGIRKLAAKLPWGKRLIAKDVTPLLEGPRTTFMKIYRHQSVNNRPFEAYCFWRWGVYAAYLKELADSKFSIFRVYTLDADVLPTKPVAQWLPSEVDAAFGRSLSVVELTMGAVILWTPWELSNFWNYVLELYSSPKRTEAWVRHFGVLQDSAGSAHTEVIPAKQRHVSDMVAFHAFTEETPESRMRGLVYADMLYKREVKEKGWLLRKVESYTCVPMNVARTFIDTSWTLKVKGASEEGSKHKAEWSIELPNVELPLCYAHFQGRTKGAIAELCNLIKDGRDGSQLLFKG